MFRSTPRSGLAATLSLAIAIIPGVAAAQSTDSTASSRADSSFLMVQAGAPAGDTAAASETAARPLRVAPQSVITKRDLILAAGLAGTAVALFPLDRRITAWLRSPERLENGALAGTLAGAEWGAERASLIAGAGLWGAGLVIRNRGVAETGFHTLASIAVTQQVTHVLKGVFGRSRPYTSADSIPHDWTLGAGFGESDRRSFPSGHTSMAFATATALSHEVSRSWPRAGKVVTPLLYAGAASAGLARIYHDQHWASDVALGAAVGILSARATLRLLHGRSDNVLDRIALSTRVVPRRGGAMLAVTLPTS
jgi:membrane-associated phospholipid phosphatase